MGKKKSSGGARAKNSGPVLVAADFSEDSRSALVWAGEYARSNGTELLVLHVMHDPGASPGVYRRMKKKWLRPMVDVAEEMLAEFLADMQSAHPDLAPLHTASSELASGLPAGRIVEMATKIGAPLIVMGSRGRTGLPHLLLGSVAERVVQMARMPVVVVKSTTATSNDK